MVVIVTCAVEKTHKFIETMVDRAVLILITTVPLAEKRGSVAMIFEDARKGNGCWADTAIRFSVSDNHINNASSLLITSGEKCGSRRTADG